MNVADLPARIASKIAVDSATDCWNWTAAISNSGYGVVAFGSTTTSAHRVTYAELVGPVADGLDVDHLCCNKRCVNPAHLEPVTRLENIRRYFEQHPERRAKPKPPKRAPRQHGEFRMYHAGCRCDLCREANRRRTYAVTDELKRRGLPDGDPRHGTTNGYCNWGCRCAPCTAAQSVSNAYYARRRAERRAAA